MRQRPSHLTPLPVVPSVTILPFNKCHKQRFTPPSSLPPCSALLCSPSFPPTAFIAKLNGLKALSIRLVPITALYALSRDGPGRQKWHTCMHGGPPPISPHFLLSGLLGLKSLLWRERDASTSLDMDKAISNYWKLLEILDVLRWHHRRYVPPPLFALYGRNPSPLSTAGASLAG